MSVFYKLYQDTRANSKNRNKWYARAVATETVDIYALADIMQQNCTVKKSDILAVLTELSEVMQQQLQSSKRVKINGLGAFRISIKTVAADTAKDFNAAKNVISTRVLFQPETKVGKGKVRTKSLLVGCRVQELPANDVEKDAPKENGGE
ncbi:MAG: HU family DNA-binding protein [Prevotella sp.]|nr:HU family DNA-binding protein [Prevotella sp.]MDD7461664.1 DNA-binding domain-containing protein [Prevotellaceae bacterium]MDY3365220.1 HU family DNA-binding protein [Prevotella sp.]MDY3853201.1 HU family DNA-binding protein [Prevotella sp.]